MFVTEGRKGVRFLYFKVEQLQFSVEMQNTVGSTAVGLVQGFKSD